MKKTILAALCFCSMALARQPEIEKLSPSALAALNAVMSPQIQKQVQDFKSKVTFLTEATVTPGKDGNQYSFIGAQIRGGDVMCGFATLSIAESIAQSPFGFGTVPVYHAQVHASGCQ